MINGSKVTLFDEIIDPNNINRSVPDQQIKVMINGSKVNLFDELDQSINRSIFSIYVFRSNI